MMAPQALAGAQVIDLFTTPGGAYCGKLLVDLGAEVLKIEDPRTGDPTRQRQPFLQDLPSHECSGLFAYLHTNKLGLTLDVRSYTGRVILRELVRGADVLLQDSGTGGLPSAGALARDPFPLDDEHLRALYPRLITALLTPSAKRACCTHTRPRR